MKPILLALFLTTVAHADGVPLFAPTTTVAYIDREYIENLKKDPLVASVMPMTLNRNAVDSDVITVTIEGTEYRFVGKKRPPSFNAEYNNERWELNTDELWSGTSDVAENRAVLIRNKLWFTGTIHIGFQRYQVFSFALIKFKSGSDMVREKLLEDQAKQAQQ
jgi:hypothetical protein